MNQQITKHKLIKYILWYQHLKNKLHTYDINGKIVELIPDKYKLDYDTIDKNLYKIVLYFRSVYGLTIYNCIHCSIWFRCDNNQSVDNCPYYKGGDQCGKYSDDIYTIIADHLNYLKNNNPQLYDHITNKTYKLSKWLYDKIELYKNKIL